MAGIKNSDHHNLTTYNNEITVGSPYTANNKPNSKINGHQVSNINSNGTSKSFISPEVKVMRVCAALVAASALALFAGILLSSITTIGVAVIFPLILFGAAGVMVGGMIGIATKITNMIEPDKEIQQRATTKQIATDHLETDDLKKTN